MPGKPTYEELEKKVKELEKTQKELTASESRYRNLAETVKDVLFMQDMDLNLIYTNPSATQLFGYTIEEALKLKLADLMTPESLKKANESFQENVALAEKQEEEIDIPYMEYEYIRKDGSTFWGELKVSLLKDSEGSLIGSQGILRNVDERKRAEEAMRQSEFRFRTLFDLSPQAIALSEVETGLLIDVNEKFCEITKYTKPEVVGRTTTEMAFYSQPARDRFIEELMSKGEVKGREMDFMGKDVFIQTKMYARILQFENRPIILTVFVDLTEEKRLWNQIQQAQKMEAVGNLAGGIAHDFNNLLMGIQGNTSLMLFESGEEHPYYDMLKSIEKSVHSGARLIRQLLDYARKKRYEVRPVDLNELVAETLESFQRTRRQIQISQDLAFDLNAVEADPAQMEQVLLNLCLNAADAMPRGGGLSVQTRNVTDEEMQNSSYKPLKGRYTLLSITDTGVGMEKEIQERIFEPFFTTKELGKGTGLGLASVYGIIKGHGGYIDLKSDPGRGTTFKVYLPASKIKAERKNPSYQNLATGQGSILIVDDEEAILNVSSKMLHHLGYKTLMAQSGTRALEILREKKDDIDLMILDVIMPGMQGGEVYDSVKEINPDLKVILSSGYSINGEAKEILKRGCDGFLQKPFDMRILSTKVGKILCAGSPDPS